MSPAELSATLTCIMESKIGHISKVFTFKRIQMNGDVIHSKACGNVVRRNSCTVFVDDAGSLEVKFYVKVYVQCQNVLFCSNECTCKVPIYYGVADCLLIPAADITLSCDLFTNCKVGHIIPARREECSNVIFPLTSVKALCVLIDCNHKECMFVCKLPNRYEKD